MTSESPYRRLRLLSGVQQKDLAQQAEVSITAMVNIEAGLYEKIPARANAALAKACRLAGVGAVSILRNEYGELTLDAAMRSWQRKRRQSYDLSQLPAMDLDDLIDGFGKPDRFCKALCVPTAALHNFRSGKLRTLPLVIQDALREAGYQHVEELEELSVI